MEIYSICLTGFDYKMISTLVVATDNVLYTMMSCSATSSAIDKQCHTIINRRMHVPNNSNGILPLYCIKYVEMFVTNLYIKYVNEE